ncbi:HCNGP-like protein-domain-containing protein [Obelidium mucronatum]|nr:HCNGP-like protein-domain-containing protein [Obelidium mucronatum]
MPLEPSRTDCDPQLQAKVEKWTHLRKTSGRRFNDTLAKTHSFGNPAIMSKLIEFLGLVEYGSNLEHSNDQPNAEFPKGMYYDEIAKAQKIAAERPPFSVNTNSVTGQTSIVGGIVFAPPSAAQEASSIGITGKRSRWDQGGVNEPAKKK